MADRRDVVDDIDVPLLPELEVEGAMADRRDRKEARLEVEGAMADRRDR
jgi:hypothetical protein